MDGGVITGPISAATIGSAVATTIKISQVIYELKAVGEQARDLLDSTQHVSDNLQTAKTLRRQKSVHLDMTEKKWIDGVLNNTDKTLNNVAALIEPARVDMQTKFGSIGFWNRSIFVFRDSPKVQTHLARLSIASGSLDTVLNVLCAREGRPTFLSPTKETGGMPDPARMRRKSVTSLRSENSSPPAYAEEEFLARGSRTSQAQRRQHLFGTEMKEAVISDYSGATGTEPLCTATWGNSPITPSTYTTPELDGIQFVSSHNSYYDKGPSIQVEEISLPDPSDLHMRMSNLSLPSQPSLRSRNSVSSIRSYASTVFSDTSRTSHMSNASTRSTGRDRGRAWMAHQANR